MSSTVSLLIESKVPVSPAVDGNSVPEDALPVSPVVDGNSVPEDDVLVSPVGGGDSVPDPVRETNPESSVRQTKPVSPGKSAPDPVKGSKNSASKVLRLKRPSKTQEGKIAKKSKGNDDDAEYKE